MNKYIMVFFSSLFAINGFALPAGVDLAELQILHRGNGAEPQTLDPHKMTGAPEGHIGRDLFENLVMEAPDGAPAPGAAQSWLISEDGLVYTFYLRDNLFWSNGDAMTADDFVYGFQRAVNPSVAASYGSKLFIIDNAQAIAMSELEPEKMGVKALDEKTIEITLDEPAPYLLGLLSHQIASPIHKANYQEHGNAFAQPGKLISNGAYSLKNWVVGDKITLERNPYYWDNDNTVIDTVYYYPTEDLASELRRYQAGELDWTYEIPSDQFKSLKEDAELAEQIYAVPYFSLYYYNLNLDEFPFNVSKKLRQALSMSIDRDILTTFVTGRGEQPAYGVVPAGIPGYKTQNYDWVEWDKETRLAKAKALYLEACAEHEELQCSETEPLKFNFLYNTDENHRKNAIAAASMWQQHLGVQIVLDNKEWQTYLDERYSGNFQMARAAWVADYLDAYSFLDLLRSNSVLNDTNYNNPAYDALLLQANSEIDSARRIEVFQQAERMAMDDYAFIPLFTYVTSHLVKPYVGYKYGAILNPMDHVPTKDLYIVSH